MVEGLKLLTEPLQSNPLHRRSTPRQSLKPIRVYPRFSPVIEMYIDLKIPTVDMHTQFYEPETRW